MRGYPRKTIDSNRLISKRGIRLELGLKGKVAIIRGLSKGIGLETAQHLVKEGARVTICARNGDHLREAGNDIPPGRIGNTDEAANVIMFLVSNAASYVTGTAVNIDGGLAGTL